MIPLPPLSLRRRGFTLLEALIVIAIIAILAALAWGASIRAMAQAVRKTTERNIQKLESAMLKQWRAALDDAKENETDFQKLKAQGVTREQFIRYYLAREFPTNVNEIRQPPGGLVPRSLYLANANAIAGLAPNEQSAACLYLALQLVRRGERFDADNSLSPRDTVQKNGVQLLVDSWGTPLAFFREPTGCPDVDKHMTKDHGLPLIEPVIVSAGENGKLGLDATMAPDGSGDANDNIYSYMLRLGHHGN